MDNQYKNNAVESTLAKYLEFRIFELFKNKLTNTIIPHCRENSKEDLYKHLFLCPSQVSKTRNFQLHGVLSPFVCLWRTSALRWNKSFYGRSVLERSFDYIKKDGESAEEPGFLYDLEFDMELFSSSYYKTFRDRVNQDLIDFDRLRYFNIDVKELLKDCSGMCTRVELMLKGLDIKDNVGVEGKNENRSFDLSASYGVTVTVPYCRGFDYLTGIEVYLNENLIYEHDGDVELVPGTSTAS